MEIRLGRKKTSKFLQQRKYASDRKFKFNLRRHGSRNDINTLFVFEMRGLLLFLSISSYALLALSSAGDRSKEFKDCLSYCGATQCGPQSSPLPLVLRLTRWTCTDNCKYTCMHQLTTERIDSGTKILQYYGKWPFWRFAGMQEPASVAFSLLNLWAHWRGASKIRREIPDANPLKSYYLWWSFASINTWIWSAVFHTRGV